MTDMNVGLFLYKQNILRMNYMVSWSMFIYVGVVYMGAKPEEIVYKAKKFGVEFFKKENKGLVYMAKKQGGLRQNQVCLGGKEWLLPVKEPCQVEEVLIGDVVQAYPGGGYHVDGALHGLTVGGVGDIVQAVQGRGHHVDEALLGLTVAGVSEQYAHNLSGGQAGTAPLDEVVGVNVELIKLSSLKMVVGETTMGLVVVVNVQMENSMVVKEMLIAWC